MIELSSFAGLEAAFARPAGWAELALIAVSLAIAWLADRNVRLTTDDRAGIWRYSFGSVNRVILPLTALALLLLARIVFRTFAPTFFLDLAVPLLAALAGIRVAVYLLRSVFGTGTSVRVSERVIAFTTWSALALYLTGVLPEVGTGLKEITFALGRHEVNAWQVVTGLMLIVCTLLVTLWLANVVEARLMRAATLDTSFRVVLAKFVRAVLLLVAILFTLSAVGIDVTVLSVFGGALGVGIGLGLQKIASNYIAGFAILLDRSIRLGDFVAIDNRSGVVAKLTSRYIVVRSLDGVEAIIPNETMITTVVQNYSYSNREIQVRVPVQVAYDTDIDLARRLLVETATAHPRVLRAPIPPMVSLLRFSDNGIDLELAVWINDPENGQGNLRSDLNFAILAAFQQHGLRIPFPQHEVRVLRDPRPG